MIPARRTLSRPGTAPRRPGVRPLCRCAPGRTAPFGGAPRPRRGGSGRHRELPTTAPLLLPQLRALRRPPGPATLSKRLGKDADIYNALCSVATKRTEQSEPKRAPSMRENLTHEQSRHRSLAPA